MSGFRAVGEVLRDRRYGTYVAGNSVSLVGLWVQRVAIGWLTWDLTHSGAWLGIVAFADLCPSLLIGPIGGVLADRWNRLRIIFASQASAMLVSLAIFGLTAAELISMPLLVALVALNGAILGFNQPARLALVPSLVDPPMLPSALAVNAVIFNLARFIGPAVAGVLILHFGVSTAFATNALTYLFMLGALIRLRSRIDPQVMASTGRQSMLGAMAAGLQHVLAHRGISALMVLALALAVGVRSMVELLPGFADGIFERDAAGLATMASAVGIGAVLGGIWSARGVAPVRRDPSDTTPDGAARRLRISLVHGMTAIVSGLAFALAPDFWLAVFFAFATGAFMVIGGISMQTLVQLSVDGAYRGRVMSLYGLTTRAGPALGALIIGIASEFIGLRAPLAVGCLLTVFAVIWVYRRRRAVEAALDR